MFYFLAKIVISWINTYSEKLPLKLFRDFFTIFDCLTDWLIHWLIEWLIDWFIYFVTPYLFLFFPHVSLIIFQFSRICFDFLYNLIVSLLPDYFIVFIDYFIYLFDSLIFYLVVQLFLYLLNQLSNLTPHSILARLGSVYVINWKKLIRRKLCEFLNKFHIVTDWVIFSKWCELRKEIKLLHTDDY